MYINIGQEDQMLISGYKLVRWRQAITWIGIIISIGILRLIFYWKPHWMIICSSVQSILNDADYVILKDSYEQIYVSKVKEERLSANTFNGEVLKSKLLYNFEENEEDNIQKQFFTQRYFYCKKIKYVWSNLQQQYEKLRGLDEGISCSYFHQSKGLTLESQICWRDVYGDNSIIIHVTPIIKLLFTQVLDPFYIFQLFSITLWYIDDYRFYASCIAIISILSLATQVYQTRSMQRALKQTLTPSSIVAVCRADTLEYESIQSDMLVPGDLIEIPRSGCLMQCDAVLINGNCIVNESMLTGESVPTTKTPIANSVLSSGEDEMFNMVEHSRHVLFCGTQVIQTRYYGNQKVRAVVIRTGYSTAKGELIRSILFPKPVDFKFTQDAFKFVGMLAVIATIGMIYTIVLMIMHGESVDRIIIRALDLITIVIPPALPAAMTIGTVFAQKRLKAEHIFCIQPRSITLCGAINTFCFDKTGTLTEEGLDMYCVVPANKMNFGEEETIIGNIDNTDLLIHAMATCHSLTMIDRVLNGDPLDLKMFQSTNWELEEPGEDATKYDVIMPTVVRPKPTNQQLSDFQKESFPLEIGIIRQFTFSSKLQRMSVITKLLDSQHFTLFSKGSPEMIASLCLPHTIPANFHDCLMYYTQQGFRVIGLAKRLLTKLTYVKIQRIQRDLVECELEFLGLVVLENRLKDETMPVIKTLKSANIRCVMVTGDNLLTALSVARDCELLDLNDRVIIVNVQPNQQFKPTINLDVHENVKKKHPLMANENDRDACIIGNIRYAVDGKSWANIRKHYPQLLNKIVVHGSVFARFLPEQKQQLIETLQELGYYVGMCGDGANDCGALKTAHAGISLSEAESSVASPFTSQQPNIKCVLDVIKEGRAALVTSFGIFKFMAGYSMTQFVSVCLLYWIGANFTDFTFLYIDLILLTSLGITFCYTRAFQLLSPKPPRTTLIAVTPVLSLISTLIVNLIFQIIAWKVTTFQPWFEPFIPNVEKDYQCYEVTVVFSISAYQYITMSIIFSKGPPFRRTIFTNYLFIGNIIISLLFTIYVTTYPFEGLNNLMELMLSPSITYRIIIVGMAFINFFISILVETLIVEALVDDKCMVTHEEKLNRRKLPYLSLDSITEDDMRKIMLDVPTRDQIAIDESAFCNMDEIELLHHKDHNGLPMHETSNL